MKLSLKKIIFIIGILASYRFIMPQEPVRRYFPYGSHVLQLKPVHSPTIQRVDIVSPARYGSDESIIRKGVLFSYPSAKANVVISHGFMCDKFDVGFIRSLFPRGKYNFLTFDFRGHGEKRGDQICTFGRDESMDVAAAVNFFKNHSDLKHLPILGYGFSMGAAATIEAQAQDPTLFKALILDCPFDSTESIVKQSLNDLSFSLFGYKVGMPGKSYLEKYAFHPYVQSFVKYLLKSVAYMDAKNIRTFMHKFSPAESIQNVSVPCFFICCKHDKRVSIDAIKKIFYGAKGPKKLWITNGRWHFDSVFYNPEKYEKRISSFFDSVLDGSIYKKLPAKLKEDADEDAMRNLMYPGMEGCS